MHRRSCASRLTVGVVGHVVRDGKDQARGHALPRVEALTVPLVGFGPDDRGLPPGQAGWQRGDLSQHEPQRDTVLADGPADSRPNPGPHGRAETTVPEPVAMIRSNRSTGSTNTLAPPRATLVTPFAVMSS